MDDALLLKAEELAAITGGDWAAPSALPTIARFALNPRTTAPGDLLITTNKEQWKRVGAGTENEGALHALLQRGGAAAVIRRSSPLVSPLNLLRVDDTYQALLALAQVARDRSQAKRILVTGTEGKTGFKMQFHHLASAQVAVQIREDSNNMERALCSALANSRGHQAISVIEVAVPQRRLGVLRSQLIRPTLCVITEIGFEHLAKHGSVDNLIAAKASVVSGLLPGGACLIQSAPRYVSKLRTAIRDCHEVPIFTFGEDAQDLGRLRAADFDVDLSGWRVRAEIGGKPLHYFVPIVEQHAPLSSVGVLAAIHLAGLDVAQAAERFATFTPFQTSGRLYELPSGNGAYRVYDQSHRNYLLGLEDFFQTAARLRPQPGGRKLLVLGQVYDEKEYGPVVWEVLPPARLRQLLESSGIDLVVTVGERQEFATILGDSAIAWQHVSKPLDAMEPLRRMLAANDLLLVKGDQNEKMFLLTDALRKRAAARPSLPPVRRPATTCLAGLTPLNLEHLPLFKESFAVGGQQAWGYYFPFLLWLSQTQKHSLLWTMEEGSLCLFQQRYGLPPRLDLYAPPLPGDVSVLRRCLERANDYNGDRSARILCIDEHDSTPLRAIPSLHLQVKEREYLYRPGDFLALSDDRLRALRDDLGGTEDSADLGMRPYAPSDATGCQHLLTVPGQEASTPGHSSLLRTCLTLVPLLSERDLHGEVIVSAGQIRAVTFGGELRPGFGCIFLSKSDTSIRGLSSFARHHFLTGMTSCALVVDRADHASPGPRQARRVLPRTLHTTYLATQR